MNVTWGLALLLINIVSTNNVFDSSRDQAITPSDVDQGLWLSMPSQSYKLLHKLPIFCSTESQFILPICISQ